MRLNRIDRKYANITVTATDEDDLPIVPTGVDVALLRERATPTAATTWTAATLADGKWRVLLAGPDASPAGALVAPSGKSDLWIRVTDAPEVDTAFAGTIRVEGVAA